MLVSYQAVPLIFYKKIALMLWLSGLQQLFSVFLGSLLLFSLTTAEVRHMHYSIVCDVKNNIFHNVITMDDLMNYSNRMYYYYCS